VQIREFLLSKLASLRKPKTNPSILQQSLLLKYRHLITFLAAHAPDVHAEVWH
jgi:vacuolar protein sorting-associated protein 52